MDAFRPRRGRLIALSLALGGAVVVPVVPAGPLAIVGSAHAAAPATCNVKTGAEDAGVTPWAQKRLGFDRAWPITQGAGVTVAVIDSGVDIQQPQMKLISYVSPTVVTAGGAGPGNTRDCIGHGTGVAGIIAAPKLLKVGFMGVAPQARIMPIKVTNEDSGHISPAFIAQGIDAAIAAHVQVINISLATNSNVAVLKAAIDRAEAADIVVVAASNERDNAQRTAYPAAYPTVLAVAATDGEDNAADFSATGSYVDIAAPGQDIDKPAPISGYTPQDGTSFAAPFVSGTVALVRAAHPELTAAQVRARLEATADPPAGISVPSDRLGYGIVNPYLAVTAVRDDSATSPPPAKQQAIPPAAPRVPPDRHLQHLALGVGTILLGLAILAGLCTAVIRRGSWFGRPPARAAARGEVTGR